MVIKTNYKLLEYLYEERKLGTDPSKIEEKLLMKGWEKEVIAYHLKLVFERGKKHPYKELVIPQGERALGNFRVGNNRMLCTEKRLIVVKKFPRNLLEIPYGNIEAVEYYTLIKWWNLAYGLMFALITSLVFAKSNSFWLFFEGLFPNSASALDIEILFDLNIVMFIVVFVLLFFTIKHFVYFTISLFGKLRILPKDEGPVDIITSYTNDVKGLLKAVGEGRYRVRKGEEELD
ncbi:hypothetical protein ACFL0X_00295 [Nanoarchaeota archaeon]